MTLDTLTWKDNDKKMVCVWKYESLIRRSTFRPRKMSKFFRFLSRRRTGRGAKSDTTDHGGHPLKKKNAVQCTVMLLDGTDFTTEIHVSLANLDTVWTNVKCYVRKWHELRIFFTVVRLDSFKYYYFHY